MQLEELKQFSDGALADYLWRRMRGEGFLDPPTSTRFGPEPPEKFLAQVAKDSGAKQFRLRLIRVIRENLREVIERARKQEVPDGPDPVTDAQMTSLNRLTMALGATDLVRPMYQGHAAQLQLALASGGEISDDSLQAIRTLAWMQTGQQWLPLWQDLYHKGPEPFRGLVIFGWSRVDPVAALRAVPEFVETRPLPRVQGLLGRLVGSSGPGLFPVADAAADWQPAVRQKLADVLRTIGADAVQLRDFELRSSRQGPSPEDLPATIAVPDFDPESATPQHFELSRAAQRGDRLRAAQLQVRLAERALAAQRTSEAELLLEACLAYYERIAQPRAVSAVCRLLGEVRRQQGRLADAERMFERALRIDRDAGQKADQAATLVALGDLRARMGQWEEACQFFDQARGIREDLGHYADASLVWYELANVRRRQGLDSEAWVAFSHALESAERAHDLGAQGIILKTMGMLKLRAGEVGTAKVLLERALHLAELAEDHKAFNQVRDALKSIKATNGSPQSSGGPGSSDGSR